MRIVVTLPRREYCLGGPFCLSAASRVLERSSDEKTSMRSYELEDRVHLVVGIAAVSVDLEQVLCRGGTMRSETAGTTTAFCSLANCLETGRRSQDE